LPDHSSNQNRPKGPSGRASGSSTPPPVFVGGTGRSGTTVLAQLIGEHPLYAQIPYEARFHAEPMGLPGVISGRVSLEEFLTLMRERWLKFTPAGRKGGLDRFVEPEQFERALEQFANRFPRRPVEAARQLVRNLLDPVASKAGKPAWVEMTPRNALHAGTLHKLFPEMKLIHIRRTGKDTARSLVAKGWQPNMTEAIKWWADRIRAVRRSTKRIPSENLLVIWLEDLVKRNREGSYRQLLEFLAIEDDPAMEAFFQDRISPEQAHIGRWRDGLDDQEAEEFLELFRSVRESIRR
jgi:Sulfotransferase family